MTDPTQSEAMMRHASLRFLLLVAAGMLMPPDALAEESRDPGGGETKPRVNPMPRSNLEPSPQADSGPRKPERKGEWEVTLGVGTLYKPAFTGSKDYQMLAIPEIKVEYQELFFASPFEGIGFNLINRDPWRAGPILKFDFGRSEEDDNPVRIVGKRTNALKGLGDVDVTPELGGFVEYEYKMVNYALEFRQGMGGHKGFVGETSLNLRGFVDQPGKPSALYMIGPRATFADAAYNQTFFGITPSQSANSGLARYDAEAGLVSYGIGAFTVIPLTDSLSLGIMGGYDRLAKTAADSPLIKERGDADQFMGSVRLSYAFGISGHQLKMNQP